MYHFTLLEPSKVRKGTLLRVREFITWSPTSNEGLPSAAEEEGGRQSGMMPTGQHIGDNVDDIVSFFLSIS